MGRNFEARRRINLVFELPQPKSTRLLSQAKPFVKRCSKLASRCPRRTCLSAVRTVSIMPPIPRRFSMSDLRQEGIISHYYYNITLYCIKIIIPKDITSSYATKIECSLSMKFFLQIAAHGPLAFVSCLIH